jgi:hypothetical protein
MNNYYEVLGLPETATTEQIKRKYRVLVREYHTDVTDYPKEWAEERVKAINAAYEVLSNEDKRAAYDTQRRAVEMIGQRGTAGSVHQAAPQAAWQPAETTRHSGAAGAGGTRSAAGPSQPDAGSEAHRARETSRQATTRRVLRPWGRVVLAVTVAVVSALISALPLLAWWWWRAELLTQQSAVTGLLLGAMLAQLVTGWWYPRLSPFNREVVLCRLLAGAALGATLGVGVAAHSISPPPGVALYALCSSLGSLVGLAVNGAVLLRLGAQPSWTSGGGSLTSMREGAQGALVVALGAALLVGSLQGELESVGLVAIMLGGLGLGVGLLAGVAAMVVMPVLDQLNGWLLKVAGRIEECPEETL